MTDEERVNQMRVLWRKARGMYDSFFMLLEEKRQEVGDTELGNWCFYNLHIGLEVCTEITTCLKEADAKRIRQQLARARASQRAQDQALADIDRSARARDKLERAQEAQRKRDEEEAKTKHRRDLVAAAMPRDTLVTQEVVDAIKLLLLNGDPLWGSTAGKALKKKHALSDGTYHNAVGEARAELRVEAVLTGVMPKIKTPSSGSAAKNKQAPKGKRQTGTAPVAKSPRKQATPGEQTVTDPYAVIAVAAIRQRPHFVGTGAELKDLLLADDLITPPGNPAVWGRAVQAAKANGMLQEIGELGPKLRGRKNPIYRVIVTPAAQPQLAETSSGTVTPATASPVTDTLAQSILQILDELDRTWVKGTLALCVKLKEARSKYTNDAFSVWLADTGIDKRLSDKARWALLNMADHLDLTREKLAQTKSRSWRLIWENEIAPCVSSTGNTQEINVSWANRSWLKH
jgi:hypothetical protein